MPSHTRERTCPRKSRDGDFETSWSKATKCAITNPPYPPPRAPKEAGPRLPKTRDFNVRYYCFLFFCLVGCLFAQVSAKMVPKNAGSGMERGRFSSSRPVPHPSSRPRGVCPDRDWLFDVGSRCYATLCLGPKAHAEAQGGRPARGAGFDRPGHEEAFKPPRRSV